jgi:hypothetical protein
VVVAVLLGCCCQLAAGDDFAISTQVFAGNATKSVADNMTIFFAGKIYDFADTAPREVTVFDTTARQFILAQPDARLQTSLSAEQLLQFAAAEQARAQQSRSQLIRFAANPTFAETFDAASGRLSLTSPVWDYDVETQPIANRGLLKRYIEFANWYTYLNALFRPIPPAVRLELNRVLDQRECMPLRVAVRIKRDGKVVVEQQSRHRLIMALGEGELKRIEQWERVRTSCETVDFATYHAASRSKPGQSGDD